MLKEFNPPAFPFLDLKSKLAIPKKENEERLERSKLIIIIYYLIRRRLTSPTKWLREGFSYKTKLLS